MARKATRKLTRREAVTLLGTGAVVGTGSTATSGAAGQPKHPSCDQVADVKAYRNRSQQALVGYTCCDETKNAILVGVDDPAHNPTSRGKAHLKKWQGELKTANLLEYCFMVWGLDEAQIKTLLASFPKQMGFEPGQTAK